jgi:hypothetical protein
MNCITADEISFVNLKLSSLSNAQVRNLSYAELEDLLHLSGPIPLGRTGTTLHRSRMLSFALGVVHARL